jgi:Cof subfamily protein (haloacid dehalogenase superfamily)
MSPPVGFRYRLAAIDIDDTLVGPDKQVSRENREAIDRLQDAGCRVVLASGREHHSMQIYQQRLGLDDFVVSSQGALVVHPPSGRQLWRRPVDPSVATSLLERGRAEGFDVLLATDAGFVASATSPWVVHNYAERDGTLRVQAGDLDALVREAPLKVLWYGPTDMVHAFSRTMSLELGSRAEVVITTRHLLEFNAPDATKATGVAAVARHYGIAQGDVVAFGDSHNDVPMLSWAGLGVAMPHALPEAHAAADVIAPESDPNCSLAVAIDALLTGVRTQVS